MGFWNFRKNKQEQRKDYSQFPPVDLKKEILDKFLPVIETFVEEDIYALSLFVSHVDYDPTKPYVYFGYNTLAQVREEMRHTSELEARWNYACWLQNEMAEFGIESEPDKIGAWVFQQKLTSDMDEKEGWGRFVDVLVQVVQEIHRTGILTKQFGCELPILIHELEYYEQIALQNIKANGKENVPESFIRFCMEY